MAPPDERGITVTNADGLIDMYPDATERVFRALDMIRQTFSTTLPAIREVLEREMTLGNGKPGEMFMDNYRKPAVETFRYANQTPRVLDRYAQNGLGQVTEYRTADAKNAAGLRTQQPGN
ncbi:hypothetical protein [Amycolatopsis sp. NPDC059021]|uniref:hypothetical protein n=1 Tax=Amycolatopsis sp. NPDC059021 TaxID=3346704 RepID=UPI00366D8F3A